jgi:tetratricopeptide (TPR) repeat protein
VAARKPGELAWSELADAVWLTLATQSAWQRHASVPSSSVVGRPSERPSPAPLAETQNQTVTDDLPAPSVAVADEWLDFRENVSEDADQGHREPPVGPGRGTDTQGVDDRPSPPVSPQPRPSSISLDMVRALRPLKRRVPSRWDDETILDEDATAERAVQDGLWLPVTVPRQTRWLDLTLVIDTGPSMALWQPAVQAFTVLLEQLGAFRTIQRRLLDTRSGLLLRGGTPGTAVRSPGELVDTSGQRVLLVLTDGAGAGWQHESLSPILAQWASAMPVALVHLLPQRLWSRGRLGLCRARLASPRPLAPNREWQFELPDTWLDDETTGGHGIPVPVLELRPRWLARWARLVTGGRGHPTDAVVLLTGEGTQQDANADDPDNEYEHLADRGEPSARERVLNFLGRASPLSFRLATLLAAVPVSLQVARAVQAEMVPESGPDHLAEVFNSGLLHPAGDAGSDSWHTAMFDFPDTVREMLLSGARRSETAQVAQMVVDRFADRIPGISHLGDAIADPDTAPEPISRPGEVRHVEIERAVMRALSGPYLPRARRLETISAKPIPATTRSGANAGRATNESTTYSSIGRVSNTMSEASRGTGSKVESADPPAQARPYPVVAVAPSRDTGDDPGRMAAQDPAADFVPLIHQGDTEGVPPVWGDVPPRNPIFTGRDELLSQLRRQLTSGGTTAILPATLHGMGGIGKTQIATEYVYRHLQDYDLVWWIQATQMAQVRAAFTDLAHSLRLPGGAEANTAVPAVREALRVGKPYRRWLLVFDSAESPEAVRPFFPSNGPGEIIITSRNPDWVGVARPLEIAVFERGESIELLRRRGPDINDGQANALAEKLGDLPLAIAQAAAWLAETGMSATEYLRLFDEKVAEILDASAPNDYEVSLAAAWNVSFDALADRNPAANQLLQVCAFFAPDPISRSIFTGVRGVSIAPELDAALRDPIRLGRAIRDINRYGLAKIDHRTDALVLHRLVQLVLRDRMAPQRRAEMRHAAHLLLANLDPTNPETSTLWPQYQAILPHAYASGVVECEDPWVRELALNLMAFLFAWGDHEEAARLATQAHDLWSDTLGEGDPQTLEAAHRLGIYLWELGRYDEAARLNQRTLQLRRGVSGENSEETLNVQANVLLDLKAKGDFLEARRLSEEIYTRARGLLGEEDPVTLTAAHNHGVSLRLVGDYHAARKLDEETYNRRVEVLGYDRPESFSTYTAIVLDRREAGEYAWARLEQEKLAERAIGMFGEDGATTARRRSALAASRRKDGDHPGALALSGPTLERFRLRYGDDHPTTMSAALGHSVDLRYSGDLDAARKLGEQTFDRFRRGFGERHPHTLAAAVDLAVTLRLLGDPAAARQIDERSLEAFRTVLGPDHPYSIVTAINLASDLAALGESEAALALGTETLERAERVLGDRHPTMLAATANLVLDMRAAGHVNEAETAYADALHRFRRIFGETHPATIAAAGGTRADCDIDTLPI